MGYIVLACEYVTLGLFCFVASPLATRYGSQIVMIIGSGCNMYFLFIIPEYISAHTCSLLHVRNLAILKDYVTNSS